MLAQEQRRDLETVIGSAVDGQVPLEDPAVGRAVDEVIAALDSGTLRVAEKAGDGWRTNAWVKHAILFYFRLRKMEKLVVGPFEYRDKIPLKSDLESQGVRVVPPGVARYGSHLEPGVILMPGYVNIGAHVGSGTMVDTWATVGSCAQVGKHVHLSGGVGIGGVLEPPQAQPVIIEDEAFIGSRCVVVEGAHVEEGAVLGANCVITSSTSIIDVRRSEPVVMKSRVPSRAVVIPGMQHKEFPAGVFGVPCALIIGERRRSTDEKTSLEEALREYSVSV
jgi:2,3,4,5-tetrahydropyridine-2-carboxylate N-succinyltransferase